MSAAAAGLTYPSHPTDLRDASNYVNEGDKISFTSNGGSNNCTVACGCRCSDQGCLMRDKRTRKLLRKYRQYDARIAEGLLGAAQGIEAFGQDRRVDAKHESPVP